MLIEIAYQQLAVKLESLYDKREASNIANWVIEKITGLKRIDRMIQKNRLLSPAEIEELGRKSVLLLDSMPVQYVLEEAWFAGMPFYVNKSVLIPRPETEELIEWVIIENKQKVFKQILDIGTGSGCIPIALKKRLPDTVISSVDISKEALQVAEKNTFQLQVSIDFIQLNFLNESNWKDLPMVDCIISNPPYIKLSEKESMSKNVLNFEPSLALFVTDEDPLIFYRKIAIFGKSHLNEGGIIFLEINEELGEQVIDLYKEHGYRTSLKQDMMGKDRMVMAEKNE